MYQPGRFERSAGGRGRIAHSFFVFDVRASTAENKELAELPQFYADMFGWEGMAKDVSNVYKSLREDEKRTTVVFCNNYGDAGTIEYYRKKYELPPVICSHNNYWYWWDLDMKITNIIIIGGNEEDHLSSLEEVKVAAIHKSKFAMPYENNLPIFICRGLKRSVMEAHNLTKHYD